MDNESANAVLDFWFGATDQARAEWFRKDPAFDALIAERFAGLVDEALAGRLDDWPAQGVQAALARIVVLDQFPRNIHRGTPRAFAGDGQALASARALVASGQDRQLSGLRRMFVYLPFEHAEDRAHQRTSMQLFEQLGRDEPALAGLLEWAQKHQVIVERFGRFPHRNAILGRASSAEEIAFLAEPGSSF